MYVTLLEKYGDYSTAYTYAVYITDAPLNLESLKDEFKIYFKLDIVDNSDQTLNTFIDYVKKNYGFKPVKNFKSYTIAED